MPSSPSHPHVAVVAFPFSSHAPKLLAVARALATAAPSATFSFLSTADSLARLPATAVVPAGNNNLRFVEVPTDGDQEETCPVWRRMEMFVEAAEGGGLRRAMEAAGDAAGGVAVSCVVGDAFMSMAAEVGVPWVAVWTGGPCALLAHIVGDAIRKDICDDDDLHGASGDELLTSYPGLGSYRVRDLPFGGGGVGGDMHRVMTMLLGRVARRLPRAATAVAINAFPGLFPPDAAVLRHPAVGAFVTHSGWGAVLEAMSGGVPMACRPFFGDQHMNARAVARLWCFGMAFDDDNDGGGKPSMMTRGRVAEAVASLLAGEEEGARMMRARARELQAMVVSAFEPDGGSTKNLHKFVEIVCARRV
uniref:UDP-glycosyltransferases domain-containing protein n=1 Tax=Oryza barthii TaxID=65489 RepID=A0A0D3GMA1_9ORYZ